MFKTIFHGLKQGGSHPLEYLFQLHNIFESGNWLYTDVIYYFIKYFSHIILNLVQLIELS